MREPVALPRGEDLDCVGGPCEHGAGVVGTELVGTGGHLLVGSTHNHHGPDTAFDVNHDSYEHMTDQAADAAVEAVGELRPARLRVGAGQHWFGMDDGTDPQVLDPRMNVLQAVATNGRVIGTVVQWNNHPETTLNWSPPADIAAACAALGWTGDNCTAEGRYFTADYPGVVSRTISERVGGETLYFVGALGEIVGPGGANVWEVHSAGPRVAHRLHLSSHRAED